MASAAAVSDDAAVTAVQPKTVIAIDYGTSACGYCIVFAPEGGVKGIGNAIVAQYKPGDRGAQANGKNATAIMLDVATMKTVYFGEEAIYEFYKREEKEQQRYLFMKNFKMLMSPKRRGNKPLSSRVVFGAGAKRAVPLLTAVAKVLEYIKDEALDRARIAGFGPQDIGWVLTVPAIWDDEAKSFMRLAAVQAGIIDDVDSPHLRLALEPEGAIIAAAIGCNRDILDKLVIGSNVMVIDCGGGTVDVTVSQVFRTKPFGLKEIFAPSGEAWGGTHVDAAFRKFIEDLMSCSQRRDVRRDPAAPVDPAILQSCMAQWEVAKGRWDPDLPDKAKVEVMGLDRLVTSVGSSNGMQALVAEFNARLKLVGANGLEYKKRLAALVLPTDIVKALYDECVDPICDHMLKLLGDAEKEENSISHVFLVGGFAESLYLQRAVRETLDSWAIKGGRVATLVVPNTIKPGMVVNYGAALWGLYPDVFIASRKLRSSYAVSLAEPYRSRIHDPLPDPSYLEEVGTERMVFNVLHPLAQQGEDMPVDQRRCVAAVPLYEHQTQCSFDVYRINYPIASVNSRTRTYVWKGSLPPQTTLSASPLRVLERDKVATLMVNVGGTHIPRHQRNVTVSMFFGSTEITAAAKADVTGDTRKATLRWERDGSATQP